MNKKEVAEIKRRLKKESCTIQHMCGCYVDAEKNKLVTFSQKFLNLEEDEFYKYLEIAGKALSGPLGNNLLELEFPIDEEAVGGRQQILMALRASKLEDDDLLDTYYDLIIDSYDYVGNYLITLYYDVYDVPPALLYLSGRSVKAGAGLFGRRAPHRCQNPGLGCWSYGYRFSFSSL